MHANFKHANLSHANLSHANLSGANLFLAILIGANLDHANLHGASVIGAIAPGANLRHAHLSGADLSSAHLVGAHLSGADLSSANLRAAKTTGADFDSVKWTQPPARTEPTATRTATRPASGICMLRRNRQPRSGSRAPKPWPVAVRRRTRPTTEARHACPLAVAAVMAHSRAVELARRPKPSIYVG